MNKILVILLALALVLCGAACAKVDEMTVDSSKMDDTGIVTDENGGSIPFQDDATLEEDESVVTENVLDHDGFDDDTSIGGGDMTESFPNETKKPTDDVTISADTEFSDIDHSKFSYEDYINMTPQQQTSFIKSFSSVGEFTKWYNNAKTEYYKNNGNIDIGEDTIDLGDIFGN